MQQGWEGTSELAHVDDDSWRRGCCSESASPCDAGVHGSKELLLRVFLAFIVGDCNGHILTSSVENHDILEGESYPFLFDELRERVLLTPYGAQISLLLD